MSHLPARCCLVLAFMWITARPAAGQVDHRVNRGSTESGGYALDKNTLRGSGGYNLTRPGFDAGASANAIITGIVTGLAGFKDFSPIPQNNQFRGELPSAGLGAFQARGVGLRDLTANRPPGTTYFFDPQRTIADTGQIRTGLNLPGSSRLEFPNSTPMTPHTMNTLRMTPNVPDPVDTRLQLNATPTPTGLRQVPVAKPLRVMPHEPRPTYERAMDSTLFGTALPTPRAKLPEPVTDSRIDHVQAGRTWAELNKPEDEQERTSAPNLIRPAGEGGVDSKPTTEEQTPIPSEPRPANEMPTGVSPVRDEVPANLGGDRFADFYNAIRMAREAGATQLGFEPVTDRDEPLPPGETEASDASRRELRRSMEAVDQLSKSAKWARDVLEDPVKTFVGKYENQLNQYLAAGEEALHAGEYYRAAKLFDLAATVDPQNPLPFLHRGHALAAAGDYVSAVSSLERGIRLFPHIAAFRVDLIALVGNRDIFDVRRADLESRLSQGEQYDLRFLLGYLEFYSGLNEEGLKNLKSAGQAAPPDSPITTFADLLSGTRTMPDLPN
jgi:hypothetical protein